MIQLHLISPGTSHVVVEESPSVRERERVHLEEEKEKKSPKNHCAMAENQTHDLSLLSRVLYPQDLGALPTIRGFDG